MENGWNPGHHYNIMDYFGKPNDRIENRGLGSPDQNGLLLYSRAYMAQK